jgi:hypothetical protein
VNSQEEFLQELFEGHVSSIVPQRPRLGIKTMMKRKGKMHVEK